MLADKFQELKVSVIIPNYNYGLYLDKCIQSILTQTYTNIEVIFVDDGSSDNSLDVVSKYRDKVRIYSQSNQGVNAARNLGISEAKGDLIALCDSDDYWMPNKIELQIERMLSNSRIGLVYSSYILVDESEKFIREVEATHRGNLAFLFISYPTKAIICGGGSTSLFSRRLLNDSMLFDETLHGNGEDWDFFRRLCQLTNVEFIERPLVYIRNHENSRGARNLDYFYEGNKASIFKAVSDEFYSWTFLKRWQYFARFEFLMFKSCLRSKKFVNSLFHLFHIIIPYSLPKIAS